MKNPLGAAGAERGTPLRAFAGTSSSRESFPGAGRTRRRGDSDGRLTRRFSRSVRGLGCADAGPALRPLPAPAYASVDRERREGRQGRAGLSWAWGVATPGPRILWVSIEGGSPAA